MAILLADLLYEKHVTLQLRSRKAANALREIIQLLARNEKIDNAKTKMSKGQPPNANPIH